MADFISWGYRIAQALGQSGEGFLAAYGENVRLQAEEAVCADVVAEVLLEFIDERLVHRWVAWKGGMEKLRRRKRRR